MNKKFIQIKEASELLGVSKLTLRNWDKKGKLKAHRHPINNYRVYLFQEVENIINDTKIIENRPKIQKEDPNSKIYKIKVIHMSD